MDAPLIRFESKEMELTGPQIDNRACHGYHPVVGRLSPTLAVVPISGPNDFHLSGPPKELLAGYRLLARRDITLNANGKHMECGVYYLLPVSYTYIYIYIYTCVCVCVSVYFSLYRYITVLLYFCDSFAY